MNGKWLNWSEFALGLWALASPWLLGYWKVTTALWSGVVAGVLIILLSLWRIVGTEENNNNQNNG